MYNNNKKIFIVTRRAGYNFGSSLQAFAIQSIFKQKGFDCEILNVKEMRIIGVIRIIVLNIIGYILLSIPQIKKIIGRDYYNIYSEGYIQRKRFDKFNNKKLEISKYKLYTEKKLKKYIGVNNIVICGSDQIWNPLGFSKEMFLSFADPKKNILASYAPSFGLASIEQYKKEISSLLERFHYISVREMSGCEIVKNLIGKDATLVLDPTLLIDKSTWQEIEKATFIPTKKYLLCYFLSTNIMPEKKILDFARENNLQIINIQTNYFRYHMPDSLNRSDVGPEEFLYLIDNASYIFTNSFHCCIFSYIYNKQFQVFPRFVENDKANQNSRIETLLQILDLPNNYSMEVVRNDLKNNKKYLLESLKESSNEYINRILKR